MTELFTAPHLIFLFILSLPIAFLVLLAVLIASLARSSGRTSTNGHSPSIRFRESFLDVVPRPAKLIAATIVCIAVTVGLIAAICIAHQSGAVHKPIAGGFILLGAAFVGSLFALLALALGYVYGDARRRNMPAVPWLLVAFFVPNLLGFLLYFVLRKPLAAPCPHCGQPIAVDQRFCPSCGSQAFSPAAAAPPPQTV